jgi:hypothetical protein
VTKKYQSISTPTVYHDAFNFLTEIYFINIYGKIKPFSWRKGSFLSFKWPKTVAIFRKIIRDFDIKDEKIAWYLHTFKPKSLEAKQFGLLVWKIKKSFKNMSLEDLKIIYDEKYKSFPELNDSYAEKIESNEINLISILNQLEL